MTVGRGKDWKTVLGSIAETAAESVELEGFFSSGFDGGAYTWSWQRLDEERSREISLRAAPDSLESGVQTEIIALARKSQRPFLVWSATTWTRHLGAHLHEDGSRQLDDEDLLRFEEELPERLQEAFAKAENVAPRLEEFDEQKRVRYGRAIDGVRDLIVRSDDAD